jgi:hypothetical protein
MGAMPILAPILAIGLPGNASGMDRDAGERRVLMFAPLLHVVPGATRVLVPHWNANSFFKPLEIGGDTSIGRPAHAG